MGLALAGEAEEEPGSRWGSAVHAPPTHPEAGGDHVEPRDWDVGAARCARAAALPCSGQEGGSRSLGSFCVLKLA